jgi:hypothetical protein
MNLFARILSHGFALVVVALLAIGLVYRGDLFPGLKLPGFLTPGSDSGQQATTTTSEQQAATPEEKSTADLAPANVAGEKQLAGDSGMSPKTDAGTYTPPEQDTDNPAEIAMAPPQVGVVAGTDHTPGTGSAEIPAPATGSIPEPDTEPADAAADKNSATVSAEPLENSFAGSATGEPETSAGVTPEQPAPAAAAVEPSMPQEEQAGEPSASPVPAPSASESTPGSPYRYLAAAREAFWLRDYALAEQKYQELIASDPGNPDGYGELGNMYFSQGEWEKASSSYYEAAVRLLDEGMTDDATQLLEVIRGLGGKQVDELEKKIRESAKPASTAVNQGETTP